MYYMFDQPLLHPFDGKNRSVTARLVSVSPRPKRPFLFPALGSGGSCWSYPTSTHNGRQKINLSGTGLSFALHVLMIYVGWLAKTVESKMNSTYSFLSGHGGCGLGHAVSKLNPNVNQWNSYGPYIPLMLTESWSSRNVKNQFFQSKRRR